MSITINGTTGIAGVDGSATTPAFQGNDTNTGLFYGTDIVGISTGGSERVRVDASGNVGVGGTPKSTGVSGALEFGPSTIGLVTSQFDGPYFTSNLYYSSGWKYASTGYASMYAQYQSQHKWYTAPSGSANAATTLTQAMTLNSSGNVLVGTTSGGTYSDCKMTLSANSGTTKWDMGPYTATPTNFLISSGTGGVFLSGSATSWSALSDERQKTNLEPIADASNKLNTLRTVTGRYITDKETVSRAFLIAQDVKKVLPEAVDAQEDEDGTLGLRYTDLIPLLIAGFKEQQVIINELKTRIEALENK